MGPQLKHQLFLHFKPASLWMGTMPLGLLGLRLRLNQTVNNPWSQACWCILLVLGLTVLHNCVSQLFKIYLSRTLTHAHLMHNVKWKSLSRIWLFVTPWTIQSMEFSRPEYSRSLSLLQGILPTQGSNPGLLHCRQTLYQLSHQGSPKSSLIIYFIYSSVCMLIPNSWFIPPPRLPSLVDQVSFLNLCLFCK